MAKWREASGRAAWVALAATPSCALLTGLAEDYRGAADAGTLDGSASDGMLVDGAKDAGVAEEADGAIAVDVQVVGEGSVDAGPSGNGYVDAILLDEPIAYFRLSESVGHEPSTRFQKGPRGRTRPACSAFLVPTPTTPPSTSKARPSCP